MSAAGLRGALAHARAMPRVLAWAHPAWVAMTVGTLVFVVALLARLAAAGPAGPFLGVTFAFVAFLLPNTVLAGSRTPGGEPPALPVGERTRAGVEAGVLLVAVLAGVESLDWLASGGRAIDEGALFSFLPLLFASFVGVARQRGPGRQRAGDLQLVLLVAVAAVATLAGTAEGRLAGGAVVVGLAFLPDAVAARIRLLPRRGWRRPGPLVREPLPGPARLASDLRLGLLRALLPVMVAKAALWTIALAAERAGLPDWIPAIARGVAQGAVFFALAWPLGIPLVPALARRSLEALEVLPVSRRSLAWALYAHFAIVIVGSSAVDFAGLVACGTGAGDSWSSLKLSVPAGSFEVFEVALVALLLRRLWTGGVGWLGPGLFAASWFSIPALGVWLGPDTVGWAWLDDRLARVLIAYGALVVVGLALLAWDLRVLASRGRAPRSARPGRRGAA